MINCFDTGIFRFIPESISPTSFKSIIYKCVTFLEKSLEPPLEPLLHTFWGVYEVFLDDTFN